MERTKPEGQKSGPGDLDRVTYSLRRYLSLAAQGNPTTMLLLWVPEEHCDVLTSRGRALQDLAPAIVSKQCGPRFMGYLNGQKQRLLGLKGQKRVKRPELEEAHGFDTKYAMHILRLAVQGIEILSTGRLTLPMETNARQLVRAMREGKFTKGEAIDLIEKYEAELEAAVASCKLQDHPNWGVINRFLVETYRETWGW